MTKLRKFPSLYQAAAKQGAENLFLKATGFRVGVRTRNNRDLDGCPMFAPAYMGRKRRAEPNQSFLFAQPEHSKNS
jgi:hypothetical protein